MRFLQSHTRIVFVAFALIGVAAARVASSETLADDSADTESALYRSARWEFSFESAYTFGTGPNPWASLVNWEVTRPNPLDYRVATQLLAAHYRLNRPSGPWLLRGSFQTSATLVGTAIVHGPETYFAGLALGLRYDFVQPRARIVPYFEMRGGPGLTDSSGIYKGQQQDFTFTYLITAGLRYDYNTRWSFSLAAIDQHLSNAYLAKANYGFDSIGVDVGLIAHF